KSQRDTVTHKLALANETIDDMQIRQRDVAALDARYTKELADAKAENDALERDVAAGRRRLYVNATCPAVPTGKSTSTARMDNAASPRLADSAQRDYFTLKERVMTMQKQLEGAQDYIRTQCQK
ncbi:lysis protein, partial [Salmonella enterica]|nr:lysis protein [Salmonella enterica]